MYSFSYLEPVCCSMSSSNCCFLTCIQISQEASKVVWYSHLFKNFPQFVVTHTVKGFSIVNAAEVEVFLEFFCFFYDPMDVGNLITGSSAFSTPPSLSHKIKKINLIEGAWHKYFCYIEQITFFLHLLMSAIMYQWQEAATTWSLLWQGLCLRQ